MRKPACVLVLLLPAIVLAGKHKTISYTELIPGRIIGSLAKPLGSLIEIQGKIIDGDKLKSKAMSGKVLLEVARVGTRKLENKVTIEFEIPLWAAVDKPKAGSKFRYLGYETGRMSGIPHQAFEHVPAVASTDLFFRVYFVAIKQIK